MYCTKCGKEVYSEDRFCANCGAEIRPDSGTRYDDVVFNRSFKQEAKRKTDAIIGFKTAEGENFDFQSKPKSSVNRESISFDWGTEKRVPRKVENVEFDWSRILEEKESSKKPKQDFSFKETRNESYDVGTEDKASYESSKEGGLDTHLSVDTQGASGNIFVMDHVGGMTIQGGESYAEPEAMTKKPDPMPEQRPEPAKPQGIVAFEQPPMTMAYDINDEETTIEDLEKEIFGYTESRLNEVETAIPITYPDTGYEEAVPKTPARDELRFYTYEQKCDAFDELIAREREKVGIPPEGLQAKTIMVEPIGKYDNLADMTNRSQNASGTGQANAYRQPQDDIKRQEQSKKLRYSDLYPRVEGDRSRPQANGQGPVVPQIIEENKLRKEEERRKKEQIGVQARPSISTDRNLSGIFDDEPEEEPKKKHKFISFILFILVLLLAIEGCIMAIKFIAPDSELAAQIDKITGQIASRVLHIDKTDDEENEGDKNDSNTNADYMSLLVSEASKSVDNIGEVSYSSNVRFNALKAFEFDDVVTAEDFEDEDWYEKKDGTMVTYGQKIMKAVVKYYDSWHEDNADDTLVGINKLEIGETKMNEDGFYTLAKVTFATADGDEEVQYQTVYSTKSEKSIVISEVKEETYDDEE